MDFMVIPLELFDIMVKFLDIPSITSLTFVSTEIKKRVQSLMLPLSLNLSVRVDDKIDSSMDTSLSIEFSSLCAKYGYFSLLLWCRGETTNNDGITCKTRCSICTLTCKNAAKSSLEILQWLRSKNCPWDCETTEASSKYGNLEILQWSVENGCDLNEKAHMEASGRGHIHILEYLHEKNIVSPFSYIKAAKHGQLNVIQWLFENDITPHIYGDDISKRVSYKAAKYGRINVLEWMFELGFTVDERCLCEASCKGGEFETLKWLVKRHQPLSKECLTLAGDSGCLEIIKYLYEKRFKSFDIIKSAVCSGYMDVMFILDETSNINLSGFAMMKMVCF